MASRSLSPSVGRGRRCRRTCGHRSNQGCHAPQHPRPLQELPPALHRHRLRLRALLCDILQRFGVGFLIDNQAILLCNAQAASLTASLRKPPPNLATHRHSHRRPPPRAPGARGRLRYQRAPLHGSAANSPPRAPTFRSSPPTRRELPRRWQCRRPCLTQPTRRRGCRHCRCPACTTPPLDEKLHRDSMSEKLVCV